MVLDCIRYKRGQLEVLDQLRLPFHSTYISIATVDQACDAIRSMQVRGAPAIAVVGLLAVAVEIHKKKYATTAQLVNETKLDLDKLVAVRPTAINIANVRTRITMLTTHLLQENGEVESVKGKIIETIESIYSEDLETNKQIGENGAITIAKTFPKKIGTVLTHCNTGSLGTSGYGTALGVIRSLFKYGNLENAYFTETRPINQGARLTAFELMSDKIPCTLICDSAVSWLMHKKTVNAVVVGADCVAMNGDVANKIGTYGIAVAAKHHNVPFYVAFPTSTIHKAVATGESIVIEQRSPNELRSISGVMTTPVDTPCWNPAFDITPAGMITGGYISEKGTTDASGLKKWLPIRCNVDGKIANF